MSPVSPETFAYILILSGFVLVFAELFVPSFGLLGIAGLALFTWGSSKIFNGNIMLIVYAIDAAALLIMAILGVIMAKSRKKPVVSGVEGMIGHKAEVIDWAGHEGTVQINGELWQARSSSGLSFQSGDHVVVAGHDDLILKIHKD